MALKRARLRAETGSSESSEEAEGPFEDEWTDDDFAKVFGSDTLTEQCPTKKSEQAASSEK